MGFKLPRLDKTMRIVSVHVKVLGMTVPIEFFGIPTERFLLWWQKSVVKVDTPGGGFGYSGETAADPYDAAQMQRLINAVAAIYTQ